MTPSDFPAAHSMDTDWFAVDRDGHVAHFPTGPSGAVPQQCRRFDGSDLDARTLIDALSGSVRWCEAHFDLGGHIQPGPYGVPGHVLLRTSETDQGPFLVFLRNPDDVRDWIRRGAAVRVSAAEAPAVIVSRVSSADARALHDWGGCLGCFWHFDGESTLTLARLGLFSYTHLDEPGLISGPYGRRFSPRRPVRIESLAAPLQEPLARVRFPDFCFADRRFLQPLEVMPCDSWEMVWLSADGLTLREIPGKRIGDDRRLEYVRDHPKWSIEIEPNPE